jgi:uncharacterized protein (TIRG00374 family)
LRVRAGPRLADTKGTVRRSLRALATLAVTGLCTAYVLWRIDLGKTAHILGDTRITYWLAALALLFVALVPVAWRWQLLLRARGVDERLPWLTRAWLVSWTAGQVLPTSVGGDATRIYEATRRHPGKGGAIAGSVLLERALGAAATLVLAAVGFVLAYGRYSVGAYLWLELGLALATIAVGIVFFSRAARRPLRQLAPALRLLRIERLVRGVYGGIHAYRADVPLLVGVFALTLAVQAARVLSIWLAGKAAGIDLSPRPYYVMGPLLLLAMLVPFTINGLAVREAFFVSFLGKLHVGHDAAFSAGFLYFVLALGLSLPGAGILAWESLRSVTRSTELAAAERPSSG